MAKEVLKKQQGFSLVLTLIILAGMSFGVLKVMPEYQKFKVVQALVKKVEQDRAFSGENESKVRDAFLAQAALEDIALSPLSVSVKSGAKPIIRVAYDRKFGLLGNAALTFHFDTEENAADSGNPLAALQGAADRACMQLMETQKQLKGVAND